MNILVSFLACKDSIKSTSKYIQTFSLFVPGRYSNESVHEMALENFGGFLLL